MRNLILALSICLKVHAFILQFGMLIEYLFEKFPNPEDVKESDIGDLQVRQHMEMNFLCRCLFIYFVGIFSSDLIFFWLTSCMVVVVELYASTNYAFLDI